MIPRLPDAFLARPLAHRGLHDLSHGRPENSPAAFSAAIEAGFGIELDVQMSSDRVAMVFHDDVLDRLTAQAGRVSHHTADALHAIQLSGGDDGIPTLKGVLDQVAGRVPVLVEIKDQDGALGPDVGPLEQAVAGAINDYIGDVAVMSFNPHAIAAMQTLLPDVPRGLVTMVFRPAEWSADQEYLDHLSRIEDFERVGASFVSHYHAALDMPRISALKNAGAPILCWTIRNAQEEEAARQVADNITFEGYQPTA